MNPTESTHFLVSIAEHPAFVLSAYFFAFLPWAVISNIDFISEKWRTVKRTRRNARIHLASYMVPVIYVGMYADAQRRTGDYKELGAALVALMFNLVQLLRTLMGIVQLDAFVAWCRHASDCIHALNDEHKEVPEPKKAWYSEITRTITMSVTFIVYNLARFVKVVCMVNQIVACVQWVKRKFYSRRTELEGEEEEEAYDFEERLMVNNTVVDNELGGRDVTVVPSLEKIWRGLEEGMLQPSRCLSTDQAELCTLRWGAAYLCGMDTQWGVRLIDLRANSMRWFLSEEMRLCREFLQRVHWNMDTNNEYPTTDSSSMEKGIEPIAAYRSGRELVTAYGSDIDDWYLQEHYFLESYSFEFDSLVGSYPGKNPDFERLETSRENVALGLVRSVIQAKLLGVERLKQVKDYHDRYHVPNGTILSRAFKLLLSIVAPKECKNIDRYFDGRYTIPTFPCRMQTVALWEESTNWRVLQASLHFDIERSLDLDIYLTENSVEPLFEDERRLENVFESCADLARAYPKVADFLGIVLETVRSLLAEWLVAAPRVPDWKPQIPRGKFEFVWPKHMVSFTTTHRDESMIFVCLNELQKNVTGTILSDNDLPSNHALIMMLMLGFPSMKLEELGPDVQRSNDNEHNIVNFSEKVYKVWSRVAPQNVSVMIRHNVETGEMSLQLENNGEETQFIWQQWVDAALGIISGYCELQNEKAPDERAITKADLNGSIVELCPLHVDEDGCVEETGVARMWEGWRAFDVRICKFEVDQWLSACDVTWDPAVSEPVDPNEVILWKEELSISALEVLNNAEKAMSETIVSRKSDQQ